jgi:hypothetical protein
MQEYKPFWLRFLFSTGLEVREIKERERERERERFEKATTSVTVKLGQNDFRNKAEIKQVL